MAKVKINITLDEDLIRKVDDYADENYMSRSGVISFATSQLLCQVDLTNAIKDMSFAMRKIADSGEIDEESKRKFEDFERLVRLLPSK